MLPTLLESNRHFFHRSDWTLLSVLAHVGLVFFLTGITDGGRQLPKDEEEARVFFLLPPDRVDVRSRQYDIIQLGKLGGDLEDGKWLSTPHEGPIIRERTYGARKRGKQSGARGELPFGPVAPFVPDTVFSVIEVDEIVQRYDGSAAPVYPRDLLATGTEGRVQAIYVVDSTGQVDTTTIQVILSDDPRFTESVRTALGLMRFRPAKRAGRHVRQLVKQQFRFQIVPPSQMVEQIS
jgi:TonB family protein